MSWLSDKKIFETLRAGDRIVMQKLLWETIFFHLLFVLLPYMLVESLNEAALRGSRERDLHYWNKRKPFLLRLHG